MYFYTLQLAILALFWFAGLLEEKVGTYSASM